MNGDYSVIRTTQAAHDERGEDLMDASAALAEINAAGESTGTGLYRTGFADGWRLATLAILRYGRAKFEAEPEQAPRGDR